MTECFPFFPLERNLPHLLFRSYLFIFPMSKPGSHRVSTGFIGELRHVLIHFNRENGVCEFLFRMNSSKSFRTLAGGLGLRRPLSFCFLIFKIFFVPLWFSIILKHSLFSFPSISYSFFLLFLTITLRIFLSGHISFWKNQVKPFHDIEICDMFLFSLSSLSLLSPLLLAKETIWNFHLALSEEDGKKNDRLTQSYGSRKLYTENISSLRSVFPSHTFLRPTCLLESYENIFDLPNHRLNNLLVVYNLNYYPFWWNCFPSFLQSILEAIQEQTPSDHPEAISVSHALSIAKVISLRWVVLFGSWGFFSRFIRKQLPKFDQPPKLRYWVVFIWTWIYLFSLFVFSFLPRSRCSPWLVPRGKPSNLIAFFIFLEFYMSDCCI